MTRPSRAWVLDASVAVKIVVEEEGSDAAAALLADRLIAPDLFAVECANTLWKIERRGGLPAGGALHRVARLRALSVEFLPTGDLLDGALCRALRLGHPVHDCLYLEAAAQHGLPLVTADRRLARLAGDGAEVMLLADLPVA